jgi:osomolarity two-component system, response regulator SSK1
LGDQKVPPPRLKKITSNETPSGPAPQPSAVILFSKDVRDSSKSPQSETTFPPPPPSPAINNQNSPAHVQMNKIPPSRSSSSESQRKLNLKVNTDPRLDEKECSLKLQLDEPTATTPASGATAFTSTPNSDSTLTPQVTDLKLAKQPVKKKTSTDTKDKQGISKILNHINVLVVEDNLVNQKIMARHLKSCKVQFQIASTGKEALEIWKKGGFHLCFMDIQLPVMSGIEVTKEIRRLERLNHIGSISNHSNSNLNDNILSEEDTLDLSLFRSPIIIVALTASTGASDQQDALAAGCNDYLTKPVQLKWLKNKLTEWGYMQALINYDFFRSEDS